MVAGSKMVNCHWTFSSARFRFHHEKSPDPNENPNARWGFWIILIRYYRVAQKNPPLSVGFFFWATL